MAPEKEFLDSSDVYRGELVARGHWVMATTSGPLAWPTRLQKCRYADVEFFILPVMKDHAPGIALKLQDGMKPEDGQRIIMRFLSAVSWVQGRGVIVEHFMGGSVPMRTQRHQKFGLMICEELDLQYLPEPSDPKARLALALMREGRGLNHPAYAFLSFYRVLEVAFPDNRTRREWMADNIDAISDHLVRERIAKLRAEGIVDVAVHLRDSGRHAIAHARSDPIINPDDPADTRRLGSELSIISALAEMAIESELGVETSTTVYRKHLYELAGFKAILGPEVVSALAKGEQMEDGRLIDIPRLGVRLRKHEPYAPLSQMLPVQVGQQGTLMLLILQPANGLTTFRCVLDFAQEHLHFDFYRDLKVGDNGSVEAAEDLAEIARFSRDYLANGQLNIVNEESGELISRKDAFIPVNCRVDFEGAARQIAKFKAEAQERRGRDERYGIELNRWLSTQYARNVRFTP